MSFVNILGAETGDLTELASATGSVAASTTHVHSPSGWSFRVNPTASIAYFCVEGLGTDGRPAVFNQASLFTTLYYYPVSLPLANRELITFFDGALGGGNPQAVIYEFADGTLHLQYFTGDGAAGNTPVGSSVALTMNAWNEIQFGISNSTSVGGAAVQGFLNGVAFAFASGLTITASHLALASCFIFNWYANNTSDGYIDDIAISTDSYQKGFVFPLVANAVGTTSAWTNGAGTSPTNVAEVPNDADTGYITSSVAGNVTTVNVTDPPAAWTYGTVKAIAYLRDLTSTDTVKVRTKSGASTVDVTSAVLTTSYLPYAGMNDVDPATSAPWTPTALKAAEIGVVNVSSIAARCTALYAMVWLNSLLVSGWWRPPSEPVRVRPSIMRSLGAFAMQLIPTQQPETIQVSKWFAQASEPVRRRAEPARQGDSELVLEPTQQTELIQVSKWWAQASEPVRRRGEPTRAGHFALELQGQRDQVAKSLAWWRQPSEPVRLRAVPTRTGLFALQLEPTQQKETIEVSKWFAQPREPVWLRHVVRPGASALELQAIFEIVTVDKWWQPASEPVRRRGQPAVRDWFTMQLTPTQADIPNLISWWQQASEPVRKLRREAWREGGPAYVNTGGLLLPVPLPSWWRPASEPVRVRPVPVRTGWWAIDPAALLLQIVILHPFTKSEPPAGDVLFLQDPSAGDIVWLLEPPAGDTIYLQKPPAGDV